jgi:hypothetical protein
MSKRYPQWNRRRLDAQWWAVRVDTLKKDRQWCLSNLAASHKPVFRRLLKRAERQLASARSRYAAARGDWYPEDPADCLRQLRQGEASLRASLRARLAASQDEDEGPQ